MAGHPIRNVRKYLVMIDLPNRLTSFFEKVPLEQRDPVGQTNLTAQCSTANQVITRETPRGAPMPSRANSSSPPFHEGAHAPNTGAPGCNPITLLPKQLAVNPTRTRNPRLCRRLSTDLPSQYPMHNPSSQRSVYRCTSPCAAVEGFRVNWDKSLIIPQQILEFLGIEVNSVEMTPRIPQSTIHKIKTQCQN